MKIFLTGATGFVGHHVAKALAAGGADLRFLIRKTSNLANLEGISRQTVVGDLADPNPSRSLWPAAMPSFMSPPTTASGFPIPQPCTVPMSTARASCSASPAKPAIKRFVYTSIGRHHALPHRRHCHQRGHAGLDRRHGRPLQALQISRRAGGHQPPPKTASRSSSSTPPPPSGPTT